MTGAIPSPNIWGSPEVYEVENLGLDPSGAIESAMRRIADWAGKHVLDIGCGAGFHLPRLAVTAASVTGVEPHPALAALARQRVCGMPHVRVREEGAASIGVPDASVDIAHARLAYFFGPGCEPGLRELGRVMRPRGTAYVIDHDATRSTFGRWFLRARPGYDAPAVERFWARKGWQRERIDTCWAFGSRDDFEAVVRIELPPDQAELALAERPAATGVDYAVNLWWRRY